MKQVVTYEPSWTTVSRFISDELFGIFGKEIECKAKMDAWDYWAVQFSEYQMPLSEVKEICDRLDIDEEDRKDTFPTEGEQFVKGLGLSIVDKLLSLRLKKKWTEMMATEDKLFLINCDDRESVVIGRTTVFYDALKSKKKLIAYLSENTPTERSLAEFCYEYGDRYKNSLYWHYPISDEFYLGAYIVMVKEGLLFLPYNNTDNKNFESFCLDDARLLRADDLFSMGNEFHKYSKELCGLFETLSAQLVKMEGE